MDKKELAKLASGDAAVANIAADTNTANAMDTGDSLIQEPQVSTNNSDVITNAQAANDEVRPGKKKNFTFMGFKVKKNSTFEMGFVPL